MKTSEVRRNAKSVIFFLSISLIILSVSCTNAQPTSLSGIRPVMKVHHLTSVAESPMKLDQLHIDVKVIGQTAITTLDMVYYNPNSRIMEGEFNFPLSAGQNVIRFALDINGTMREGVVVEKELGRKTFEAIVRRGVDPGLLEKAEGDNYRVRVYPLPAKGTRRVILAFEEELTDKGDHDLYLLPLGIQDLVSKFSFHAEVVKRVIETEPGNVLVSQWNDSYVADFKKDNYKPNEKIELSFPHTNPAEQVYTAPVSAQSDSSYFYIALRTNMLKETKKQPSRITLLWDNSGSAVSRKTDRELALLDAYFHKISNVTVELVTFNIKASAPKIFTISDSNWSALHKALQELVYDGGTDLGAIDAEKLTGEEILLFSDGISNYGKPVTLKAKVPVYAINSSSVANSKLSIGIVRRSGGAYVDMNKLSEREALDMLLRNDYQFISAEVTDGEAGFLYPGMPAQCTGTFSLAGIMTGKTTTVKLNFGFGKKIVYSRSVTIQAAASGDAVTLGRLWGEKKIADLSTDEELNHKEITMTGTRFGIVTPGTSLIVLENISDYLMYGIVPPAEMQKEYSEIKAKQNYEKQNDEKAHIERVIEMSDEQTRWWQTEYPLHRTKSNIKFTAPSIRRDEEVRSQEALSSNLAVSIADVKGNDEENDGIDEVVVINPQSPGGGGRPLNKAEARSESVAKIEIAAWDPQTPYLKVLQYTNKGDEYTTYLKLKKEYGTMPAFYLDVAGFFANAGKRDTAVVILSNLAELNIESPELLRLMGYKLTDMKRFADAVRVFEKVLKIRGEEPQAYRDLGLAYEANHEFQLAVNTLYEVVRRNWDGRFEGIELITMNEINQILIKHPELNKAFIDKRLIKKEPVDVRVVLTWDTDNCDMDLWVTDPHAEKCYYENALTAYGGKISRDFTQGYGPEEYMIKKAVDGKYFVQANYYGTRSQKVLAPVNLHLVFYTNYGKNNQKKRQVTVRLESRQDVIDIGKFIFAKPADKAK